MQLNQLTLEDARPSEKAAGLGNARAGRGMVRIDTLLSGDSPRLSGVDKAHVRRLAEASGGLPPIVVHRPTMRIVDGAHRVQAAILNHQEEIEAEFFDGSEADAFIQAVELNVAHGLPLTMAERKSAAARIVATWPDLSDRAVARSSGLSDKTIAAIRRSTAENPRPNARRGQDGRFYPVDGSEGRRRASRVLAARPDAPLREVAQIAGISVSTAKDVRDRLERGEGPFLPERSKPAGMAGMAPPSSARPVRSRNPRVEPGPADAVRDISMIFEKLKRDPSLRFSEDGREFLRLLQLQCVALEKWPQLIERLPDHCIGAVTRFAHHCAEEWSTAARALQKRGTSLTLYSSPTRAGAVAR